MWRRSTGANAPREPIDWRGDGDGRRPGGRPVLRRSRRPRTMRQRTDGRGFATRAIHAGERPDPTTHAHNTPIYANVAVA
jgi:hypothetical protein